MVVDEIVGFEVLVDGWWLRVYDSTIHQYIFIINICYWCSGTPPPGLSPVGTSSPTQDYRFSSTHLPANPHCTLSPFLPLIPDQHPLLRSPTHTDSLVLCWFLLLRSSPCSLLKFYQKHILLLPCCGLTSTLFSSPSTPEWFSKLKNGSWHPYRLLAHPTLLTLDFLSNWLPRIIFSSFHLKMFWFVRPCSPRGWLALNPIEWPPRSILSRWWRAPCADRLSSLPRGYRTEDILQ